MIYRQILPPDIFSANHNFFLKRNHIKLKGGERERSNELNRFNKQKSDDTEYMLAMVVQFSILNMRLIEISFQFSSHIA